MLVAEADNYCKKEVTKENIMICRHDRSDANNCRDCRPGERTRTINVSLEIKVNSTDVDCGWALEDEALRQLRESIPPVIEEIKEIDLMSQDEHVRSLNITAIEVHCE